MEEEVQKKGDWIPRTAGRIGPKKFHLMFADEFPLSRKAAQQNMRIVSSTLYKFFFLVVNSTSFVLSGRTMRLQKTHILFSRIVDLRKRTSLTRQFRFKETTNMDENPGVPLLGRATRKQDYQYVVHKVKGKLLKWKSKHLSFSTRVTLHKSIIQAILVYSMVTIPIPKSCL